VDGFGSLSALSAARVSVAELAERTLLSDEQAEALHDIVHTTGGEAGGADSSGVSRNNSSADG